MKTTRKSLRIGMAFVVALGIMGMIIASMRTSTVFAAAGSGSNLGGQCAPAGKTIYWDTCYGATWRYYSIGQSSQTFVGGVATATPTVAGTDNAPGGTISGCEDVGGYYILGLEVYNPQNMQSYGYQKGIVKSTNLAVNGGTYAFREVPGSDSLDTVAYKFALAEAAGATNGYTWDSNLGWFCYSPEFEYKDTEGSVQSSSGVEVKAQGGDITPHVLESEKDGHATLKISTDQSSVLVDFFHKIHYNGIARPAGSRDVYDNVGIGWSTKWGEGGMAHNSITSGTYNTNGTMDNSNKEVTRTASYRITIEPGQTITYCQRITYDPKNVKMRGIPVTDSNGRVLYYHYSETSRSGNGYSEACIEITRPKSPTDDPEPNIYPGPSLEGGNNVDVLYAGEQSRAIWRSRIENVPTRRYAGLQTVNYSITASQPYVEGINEANNNYRGANVCSYASTQRAARCEIIEDKPRDREEIDNSDSKFREEYSNRLDFITPDYVGDKYCNTMGYKLEYWYGEEKNGQVSWHKEEGKDYWAIFGSVCRTIAKKPSVAVWNGSIITNNDVGIRGISSKRYTDGIQNAIGKTTEGNSNIQKFGSWAEHLDVIGGGVADFASGSTLARGSDGGECLVGDILGCSPLTISNNTPRLGFSGISRNSSYQARLQTFLRNRAKDGTNINTDFNTPSTNIYKYTSNSSNPLTITNNITYPDGPYNSIYQLPQNIIFVDGDLNIASNVTRIDAWLIVSGKINTCSDFGQQTAADSQSLRQTTCTSQLAINGPVIANGGVALNRSYGSDPIVNSTSSFGTNSERDSPAEIFNLRQDSYLWAYAQAGRYDSSYTESYSRELAPRY